MSNDNKYSRNQTINKELAKIFSSTDEECVCASTSATNDGMNRAAVATASASAKHYKGIGVGADAETHVSAFECQADKVGFRAATAKTETGVEAGIGGFKAKADAAVNLMEAEAGPVNVTLGVGVATGGSVGPGGVEAKVLGTGISVGKKTGISVLGNEFAIDFGKTCTIQ